MPLSKKKQDQLELQKRRDEINSRSLDGKGLFMEANWERQAREYMKTGDRKFLEGLPLPDPNIF